MASPGDIKRAALVSGAILAALGLSVPLIQQWEGLQTRPYADVTGIRTVCFGETGGENRSYTPDECATILIARLSADFAPPLLKCVPGLADRPKQLAASLSLAWNIGTGAFCKSTAAKRFKSGDWKGGCDAFLMWRYAGGKELRGLLNRRKAERDLCLSDLP